jgi:hypothetical protein
MESKRKFNLKTYGTVVRNHTTQPAEERNIFRYRQFTACATTTNTCEVKEL